MVKGPEPNHTTEALPLSFSYGLTTKPGGQICSPNLALGHSFGPSLEPKAAKEFHTWGSEALFKEMAVGLKGKVSVLAHSFSVLGIMRPEEKFLMFSGGSQAHGPCFQVHLLTSSCLQTSPCC